MHAIEDTHLTRSRINQIKTHDGNKFDLYYCDNDIKEKGDSIDCVGIVVKAGIKVEFN